MCLYLRSASWKTELEYDWVRHLDVHHFVMEECSHNYCERLHNQMWLHRFYVISLYIMSGRKNILYEYYRIYFGICIQCSMTLWLHVVQPFTMRLHCP